MFARPFSLTAVCCLFSAICCSQLLLGTAAQGADISAAVPTFDRDVMPIVSQAGCNMGACHGNLHGKGGLKLSLRGEDPAFDYNALTRQHSQRRIDVFQPDESLLLQKAIGRLGHGGGKRISKDSLAYRLLYDWMQAGAKGPDKNLPALTSLEVTPAEIVDHVDSPHVSLTVTAHFEDGSQRDVTQLATYETSNTLLSIASPGNVQRDSYGEGTVLVRYLQQQVPVRVAFVRPQPDFAWHGPDPSGQIDEFVFAKLKQLTIPPAAICDDATFCRRIWLDLCGALPTPEDAQAFVADQSPDKRERLVDSLLAQPEFADFWTLKWADLLRAEEKVLDTRGVDALYSWIRTNIATGRRLDAFVHDLIAAEGSTYDNPPANFYRVHRDATSRGETVARLFLGVRLQCARCHNHPFDRWTMDDYYSWSALFARIDYKLIDNTRKDKLDLNEFIGEQFVIFGTRGELKNPRTGQNSEPQFLGSLAGNGASKDKENHRKTLTELAGWITSPENELFATSQVNLIWFHLLGRGLIDPIDDVRATNPPSHPHLLAWLRSELVASEFDLRTMIRTICNSRAYQFSAQVEEANRADEENYSHALVRRLTAEQLVDAQSQALGNQAAFGGYPAGTWARQVRGVMRVRDRNQSLGDGDQLLRTFGKNSRLLACECERSNDATLQQAFVLIGSDTLEKRLESEQSLPAELAQSNLTNSELISRLYWAILSRQPTSAEVSVSESLLEKADDRHAVLTDLTWALLNSKEFLFRH